MVLTDSGWERARRMLDSVERGDYPVRHDDEDEHDTIGLYLDDGSTLFRIRADGTVEAPDHARLGEAAELFFEKVLTIARTCGWRLPAPEGFDSDGLERDPEHPMWKEDDL